MSHQSYCHDFEEVDGSSHQTDGNGVVMNIIQAPCSDGAGSETACCSSSASDYLALGDRCCNHIPLIPNQWTFQCAEMVQRTVWAAGRRFGFQAFNINPLSQALPQKQFVPATLFLAADHIHELITNEMLRDLKTVETSSAESQLTVQVDTQMMEWQRFSCAVWEVHSCIFLSYSLWLKKVQLKTSRTRQAETVLQSCSWDSPEGVHGLVTELAMYFLLWSEAANLRHCPEAMWFFYHCMVMSPEADELWVSPAATTVMGRHHYHSDMMTRGNNSCRDQRIILRNNLQVQILHLQRHFQHQPSSVTLAQCAEVLGFIQGKVPHPASYPVTSTSFRTSTASDSRAGIEDCELLEDLVAYGDGGMFMDRVVSPVFTVMAYELDNLVRQREDIAFRLGYDDMNESLTHPAIVKRTLSALGASKDAMQKGTPHNAFQGIMQLGMTHPAEDNQHNTSVDQEEGRLHGSFDVLKAAVFWSSQVFVKTYYERRSWLALYRAFHRVYTLQAVLLHVLLAAAFTEGQWSDHTSWTIISSAVITHAFCAFVERWSNMWMCRRQIDPIDQKQKRLDHWTKAKTVATTGSLLAESNVQAHVNDSHFTQLAAARKKRHHITVEGAPFLSFSGPLEYFLVLAGLLGMFVLQYLPQAGSLNSIADQYWLYAAGGYTAMVIGHGLLTSRDGKTLSLSALCHLPRIFTSFSTQPPSTCWLEGDVSIGWTHHFMLSLFWILCIALKAVFDYFVLWKPSVQPVILLLNNTDLWLPCNREYLVPALPIIPCVDGVWLLIIVRLFPNVLVSFIDLAVAYQIVLVVFGILRGLISLDIGVVGDFNALVREFHRAPLLWWLKIMSKPACSNILTVSQERLQIHDAPPHRNQRLVSGDMTPNLNDPAILDSRSVPRSSHNRSGSGSSVFSTEAISQPHVASSQGFYLPSLAVGLKGDTKKGAAGSSRTGSSSGASSHISSSGSLLDMKPSAVRRANIQALVMDLTDEHAAMWDSFASAWDEIVEDLRESDLINNKERDNLRFIRLGPILTGIRPVLLPLFWTAGQVQRVIDTGMLDTQQSLVVTEIKRLLLYLGSETGLLTPAFVEAAMATTWCNEALNPQHSKSRSIMVRSMTQLLACLHAISSMQALLPEDLRRISSLYSCATSALHDLLQCVEFECRAVKEAVMKQGGKLSKSLTGKDTAGISDERAESLRKQVSDLQEQLNEEPSFLTYCVKSVLNSAANGRGGSQHPGASFGKRRIVAIRIIHVLHKMLSISPAKAKPSNLEAQRILTFFMSSLSNRQLSRPSPLHEMPSWTTLTPLYEEDVLYALDGPRLAQGMGYPISGARDMADLMTETEDSVSLISYLRSVYPKDWECFKERLSDQLGGELDLSAVNEADFNTGGALQELGLQLQLWASFRGQLLARTVRGMICYQRALRILARLEYPYMMVCHRGTSEGGDVPVRWAGGHLQSINVSRREYEEQIEQLINKKFALVVTAQMYGEHRRSNDVRQRWLADSLDTLLEVYSPLKVAFLDSVVSEAGPTQSMDLGGGGNRLKTTQYSVLVSGRTGSGRPWDSSEMMAVQRVEEQYRVRLPQNLFSSRGVILGEGKPENQNHAIIFCHGEALQTIDMNQDNNLAEALKMRNLLSELKSETTRGVHGSQQVPHTSGSTKMSAGRMMKLLSKTRANERPTAIVGFREWIFSDKAGALGLYAASAEFAFSSIIQRIMDTPAHVRMHYGHPDVFNKMHCMTRGGCSKATRQLHISEDVFSGYNHTLRGASIKYREYISVGKGRDMGFDSINAFEIKTSGGAGNILISRDLWRLASRFDVFRNLHFYYSGCGNYVNTWLLMVSIYASIFCLVFFSLANISTIIHESTSATGQILSISWDDTFRSENMIQLGMLAVLPYMAELVLEQGLARALLNILHQVLSGALAFFITRQQTTKHYLQDVMQYGGAQYIGTGRGFAYTSSSFVKLYTNYARTHIYPGFELGFMCVVYYVMHDCIDCNLAATTWGTWLVSASLIFSPFWFNPLTFSITKTKKDYEAWKQWIRGEVDPGTGTSWYTWNKKQLEKIRNDHCDQPSRWLAVLPAMLVKCGPLILLTFSAVSRLTIEVDLPGPSLLHTQYTAFILFTSIIWALVSSIILIGSYFKSRAQQRSWRVFNFWSLLSAVCMLVAYFVVLTRWYSGDSFSNLMRILYANLCMLRACHHAATHLAIRSPRARAIVDQGYWIIDAACGTVLLAVIGLLSLLGVVAWAQHQLLFSISFARSIRRGQLVRTLGTLKAEAVQNSHLDAEAVGQALAGARSRAASSAVAAGAEGMPHQYGGTASWMY
ncbi:hypothetical protein CEUSTIGMA_g7146.t1 [Chlamydomonas eustigma]|uniref:1,3-beta-glucan synthase n=1 Tax=Chlamydomonas eustigma TaxID=1157962 RepID=A0A250X9D7_9CHLO|nr:hypothetical protein CEUSTIGMA_g7146.t1 [Chlamydomonas eustigma]|eukprot:GAX79705.1 hypothetical protein CEUSTIGMA_g7146.t1 [Chlamydomonas eustigma]